MGEGDNLGIAYELLVMSPYIAVGAFCLIGALLLIRKGRGSKILGGSMLVVAALGIFALPFLNSVQQDITTKRLLAEALIPDAIVMQNASVVVIGSRSEKCALICAVMFDGNYASKVTEVHVGQGPSQSIYRAGPFDLTTLTGRDANERFLKEQNVTGDVEFVLFNETHWLAYHDSQSFLEFPEHAYSGVFLFRVTDPHAFDIAQAELVLRIYQSEQKANRFLWFSETSNDSSLPSDVRISEIFETALANGNIGNNAD